jgi:DNA-binding beta-propeller fold protein YncE
MAPHSLDRPIGIVPNLVAAAGRATRSASAAIRSNLRRAGPMALRAGFLAVLTMASAAHEAQAQQVLFVVKEDNYQAGHVGAYNAATGATINATFIPSVGGGRHSLVFDGNNHLLVTNSLSNSVGEYDASTGATINADLISQGLNLPTAAVIDGNNHLFVANQDARTVGKFNATTGATINPAFISIASSLPLALASDGHNRLFEADFNSATLNPVRVFDATTGGQIGLITDGITAPSAFVLDSLGNRLFVANWFTGSVGEYNAATLATINASFIAGPTTPTAMVLDGHNHLFIADRDDSLIAEFDATTGALVNGTFLAGSEFAGVWGMVVATPGGACYANCDGSTTPPILNIADFVCFQQAFAAGCP